MITLNFEYNGSDFLTAAGAAASATIENVAAAEFSDGVGGAAVSALTVNVKAVQEGSGTPAGDNVRALVGWDGATIRRTGKNLWPRGFTKRGTSSWDSSPIYVNKDMFPLRLSGLNNAYNSYPMAYDAAGNYIGRTSGNKRSAQNLSSAAVFTADSTANHNYDTIAYIKYSYYSSGITNAATAMQRFGSRDNQAELGGSTTTFEEYRGDSVSFDWSGSAGTIYGGVLDVIGGKLTKTWGYIASYAGEALPGEWISDRDVYASGTTPTTGAEVAYELAEADYVQYTLTVATLSTLFGDNVIFADCGDIGTLTYSCWPASASAVGGFVNDKSGFMVAERDYDKIVVPGCNGTLTLDNGRWENVDGAYKCAIVKNYGTKKPVLQRWLAALGGAYGKLCDTEEPNIFRLARFKGIKEKRILADVGAALEIGFDCMPQRFLISGDIEQSVASGSTIYNLTDQNAEPLITVTGSGNGTLTVNGTAYAISSIATSVTLDCATKRAYSGTTPKDDTVAGYPVLIPGANTVSFTGGITAVSIKPRWWQL